jgi:hypothetical protein
LALHAAALRWKGRSIILPGISGTGKSTLAAALLARGGELFSDEVALVLGDGTLAPIPLPPGLKSGSWPLLAVDYPCWLTRANICAGMACESGICLRRCFASQQTGSVRTISSFRASA